MTSSIDLRMRSRAGAMALADWRDSSNAATSALRVDGSAEVDAEGIVDGAGKAADIAKEAVDGGIVEGDLVHGARARSGGDGVEGACAGGGSGTGPVRGKKKS